MIRYIEPVWWQNLLLKANEYISDSELLIKLAPLTADIFVFIYPLYLTWLYLYWIRKNKEEYKYLSLYIFFSWVVAIVINFIIKLFITKDRPEQFLENKNSLLLNHIPNNPFPSDHASLSVAIWFATLLWWIKSKNRHLIIWGIMLITISLIMSLSRVGVWVHRPTDILIGTVLWFISAYILLKSHNLLNKYLYSKLINIEIRISNYLFKL